VHASSVVVGVTGHRILAEVERVSTGVEDAVVRIGEAFPGRALTVLSALAEGADRLVVEAVLERPDGRLVAVLPLPADDYETDFRSDESKRTFRRLLGRSDDVVVMPSASTREEAYEAAGRHVLENCDVLLTVWDGHGAQGQGGTGAIVAEARGRGLPIAWVHAGNRRPGTEEPTSLGEEQGLVTYERLGPGG
jgi:hypothetical protein